MPVAATKNECTRCSLTLSTSAQQAACRPGSRLLFLFAVLEQGAIRCDAIRHCCHRRVTHECLRKPRPMGYRTTISQRRMGCHGTCLSGISMLPSHKPSHKPSSWFSAAGGFFHRLPSPALRIPRIEWCNVALVGRGKVCFPSSFPPLPVFVACACAFLGWVASHRCHPILHRKSSDDLRSNMLLAW